MGFIAALWLPILLSAVVVFIVSSLIHMALGYHNNDFAKLANEDAVMEALRKLNIPEGDYMMPCAGSSKAMRDPEFKKKMTAGPLALLRVMKAGMPNMTPSLIMWFIYNIVISIFAAYIASHAVPWGGPYLSVFRFVGCSAFMAYSLALLQDSIWFHKNWGATLKSVFDGLIYGLLTAGIFGWLWPKA